MKEPIAYMAPEAEQGARALGTCRKAIFYHEIFERVSQRANKSWYIHGFIVKVPRVQLAIGDESAVGISALELQNEENRDRISFSSPVYAVVRLRRTPLSKIMG
eukprot:1245051-Pleurochrysis_carterae.AAC.1